MSDLDLSVVICTHNRADSLRETLEALLRADDAGVAYEVIVVDNGSTDRTPAVVDSFRARLAVRYLYEPVVAEGGKGRSLNRALESGSLGRIVAVIDDDISVDPGWHKSALAICGRWPDYDFFAGPIRIDRPPETLPRWILDPPIKGWMLAVLDHGPRDVPLRDGGAFAGGHFWFRSSVLTDDIRFEEIWFTEPPFYNLLLERGHKGMYGPDASAVHRFQNHLLDPDLAIKRARETGISAARMRLQPYRHCIKAARLCHRYPLLARLFCAAQVVRWGAVRLSCLFGTGDSRIRRRILAAQGISYYSEVLRLCSSIEDYRVFGRRRASTDSNQPSKGTMSAD